VRRGIKIANCHPTRKKKSSLITQWAR